MEKQCKALKINNQQCTRTARKNSPYCWQHKFSRLKDAPWYKNTIFHTCMGILATILFGLIAINYGATKAKQNQGLLNDQEILNQIANLDKKFIETVKPVLTKEDTEQLLSAKEMFEYEKLILEWEILKLRAKKADLEVQLSLYAQLSYASALLRLARYEDAEKAYLTILSGHPDNTFALSGLGFTLMERAQYTESEKIVKRALTIEETADPNSIDAAAALNNLAVLYMTTNRFKEAELLYKRALKINEDSFGKDHYEVATNLNNLAGFYYETNQLKEAESNGTVMFFSYLAHIFARRTTVFLLGLVER